MGPKKLNPMQADKLKNGSGLCQLMNPGTAAHAPQGVFLGPRDMEGGISLLPSLHQELSYGEGNPKSGLPSGGVP